MQWLHDTLPSLFIPHGGGPCFFMEWPSPDPWAPMRFFLSQLITSLPHRPTALLVVSAHWEESPVAITAHPTPPLIFDYYGFPSHTYELTWPAPGNPSLAATIRSALQKKAIECRLDETRGFDHGVFIPLKVALPDADIPTLALSLREDLDPEFHMNVGEALHFLRQEGVLIVGSGMSFHNLGTMRSEQECAESSEFDTWLTRAVESHPIERSEAFRHWQNAPHARLCHPREEHLAPIFVASGAAREENGRCLFTGQVLGAKVSAYQFG